MIGKLWTNRTFGGRVFEPVAVGHWQTLDGVYHLVRDSDQYRDRERWKLYRAQGGDPKGELLAKAKNMKEAAACLTGTE